MNKVFLKSIAAFAALLGMMPAGFGVPGLETRDQPLKQGKTIRLGAWTITIKKLETLPYVESEYTRRFKFDSFDNPKLEQLRERYHLDTVIAPGIDEFSKQLILNDWVHSQFEKFGQPSIRASGALEILNAIREGHTFFCAQYAQLLVSTAASLGWIDRPIALRRHQGVAKVGGSTEHSVTEIWSNQHGKWIMLDPTSNMYLEKGGVPLNAWEIREEWFYRDGEDLVFVIGKERKKCRKSDLPVVLKKFAGFGDLAVYPDELDKYGFIGFIPNTNLMDEGLDYAQMFIVKDKLCDGTRWHKRVLPANPATDPYFPIGQAALSLFSDGNAIRVSLRTMTPNFKEYEVSFDEGPWHSSADTLAWEIRSGPNRIAARTVNRFGVRGPVARAEIEALQ